MYHPSPILSVPCWPLLQNKWTSTGQEGRCLREWFSVSLQCSLWAPGGCPFLRNNLRYLKWYFGSRWWACSWSRTIPHLASSSAPQFENCLALRKLENPYHSCLFRFPGFHPPDSSKLILKIFLDGLVTLMKWVLTLSTFFNIELCMASKLGTMTW